MKRYYLGVDGGQTSTVALIADEKGKILGRGKGGPCNHVGPAEGRARFFSALGDCLREAFAQAGLQSDAVRFASVCLGFSGGPQDKEAYVRELIPSERYRVTHDAEIALEGATGGLPGIIVIAGTGSMAFGRNAAGETSRAGGWGYVFGDEGGAFYIARQILRMALAYEEGWGRKSAMYAMLLEAAGADNADQILRRFYAGATRSTIAAYASVADQAAQMNDETALEVLTDAAEQLAAYAQHVCGRLFPSCESVEVAYVGGVFQSDFLRDAFVKSAKRTMGAEPHRPRLSPAAGALLRSLRDDDNLNPLSDVPESET